MLQSVENFLHSLRPEWWLIYHVNFKAVQCGAVVGITAYIINASLFKSSHTKSITNPMDENKKKQEILDIDQMRRYLYQSFVFCLSMGIGVTIYNLVKLEDDILQDRVYRIINSNAQKQIDYSCIIGGSIGLLYSLKQIIENDSDITLEKYTKKELLEYAMSNGLIGVGAGVMFHFIRTRNIVPLQRIWMYTSQCWS